jgi:hypothetical protein
LIRHAALAARQNTATGHRAPGGRDHSRCGRRSSRAAASGPCRSRRTRDDGESGRHAPSVAALVEGSLIPGPIGCPGLCGGHGEAVWWCAGHQWVGCDRRRRPPALTSEGRLQTDAEGQMRRLGPAPWHSCVLTASIEPEGHLLRAELGRRRDRGLVPAGVATLVTVDPSAGRPLAAGVLSVKGAVWLRNAAVRGPFAVVRGPGTWGDCVPWPRTGLSPHWPARWNATGCSCLRLRRTIRGGTSWL